MLGSKKWQRDKDRRAAGPVQGVRDLDTDVFVSDVVEPAKRRRVLENHLSEEFAVKSRIRANHRITEGITECAPRRLTGPDDISSDLVSVNHAKTEAAQISGRLALSCADATRDGNTFHGSTLSTPCDMSPATGGGDGYHAVWLLSLEVIGGSVVRYVIRRILMLIGIAFIISVGSFYLIHLLPGNITTIIEGPGASPANQAKLYKLLGLDRPIYEQYFVWLGNVLHGNLGTSFISQESVASTIRAALPIDLEMIFISQVLAFAAAIPMAMRSARKPDGIIDRIFGAGSFTLLSVPPFIVIILLVLFISIKLGIPHTGVSTYVAFTSDWIANLESMALPAVTLAIGSFVVYFRVLRSDLIATLQEEFITMARSKGISQRRIMWRHAFRPSSVALLGAAGVNIGGLLAGGFVVQFLLAIPGLGYTLIAAINQNDYLLVQGIVFVVSVGVVLINFIFDFIINIVDPRISRE